MASTVERFGPQWVRQDLIDKVQGKALFTWDVKLPGMLHARVLRAMVPHALIKRIDVSKAAKAPGVEAVVTADDLPDPVLGVGVLASHKVRYAGDAVAAVAARTAEQAAAALALIEVEYEPLPAVFDPEEAMAPGAPLVGDTAAAAAQPEGETAGLSPNVAVFAGIEDGDIESAFAEADVIVEETYRTQMVHQAYIEPRIAVAQWHPGRGYEIWTSTQSVHAVRADVAIVLKEPQTRVIVHGPFPGGAFGGKTGSELEPIVCLLARKSGRPVRLANTREEEFLVGNPRHPSITYIRSALKKDGTILGRHVRMIMDTGAYPGGSAIGVAALLSTGPYRIGAVKVEGYSVLTNKSSCGSFRGPGGPQADFAVESHMDSCARALGMDPVAFRLKNAWVDGDRSPTGQVMQSVSVKECLEAAAKAIGWPSDPNAAAAGSTGTRRRGVGVAVGWWFTGTGASTVTVKLNDDGTVAVQTTGMELGSGSVYASLPAIVAKELNLHPSQVVVAHGDTSTGPYDVGSWGSRITYNLGGAARAAAVDLAGMLKDEAAKRLGVSPDGLAFGDQSVYVQADPQKRLGFRELARVMYRYSGPPVGRGSFVYPRPGYDRTRVRGDASGAFNDPAYFAQAVEVEVDMETGQVTLLRAVAAQDVGRAINPQGIEGQIEGGMVQAIGQALYEEMVWQGGKLVNPNFADYKLPTATDVPAVESIILEKPSTQGPYGVKGVGEPPTCPTLAAIANAVYQATGVRIYETPLTPERVFMAIRRQNSS